MECSNLCMCVYIYVYLSIHLSTIYLPGIRKAHPLAFHKMYLRLFAHVGNMTEMKIFSS